MPNNPSIQDTLGTIYMLLGTLDKADDALALAMSLVQGPEESAAVVLHLAQLRILQNKKDEAENFLRRAEELLKTDQRLSDQYTPLLNELKGKLEAK
jgi:Flp pilus assembly protein TadD